MAPTSKIHLIRHAQGFHNLSQANQAIHDPLLTPRGIEQCTELQANFPHHGVVDLIVSSPIRRTLYTSLLSFKDDIAAKRLTIIALPEAQETSDLPCDTGSSPEELAKEFAGEPINFSLVQPGWNVKTGRWAPKREAVVQRAVDVREWLLQRPESEIVVVTHGGFLHYITDDCESKDKLAVAGWGTPSSAPTPSITQGIKTPPKGRLLLKTNIHSRPGAHLIETEESKQHRAPKPLDHNEVTQLKRTILHETADKAVEANTNSQAGPSDHADVPDASHQGRSKV